MRLLLLFLLVASLGFSREYKIVFYESTPPFVFKDGTGIVQTIVKEAMAYKGHTVEPVFVNMGRAVELFKDGYVDGATIIQKSSGVEAFYSADFMHYHNAVFALKKNHYNIRKIDNIVDYQVVAFQNAKKYLGEDFGRVANKAGKKYTEVADQKQQVYQLFMGRTDITIMDRHIFKFYRNQLINEGKIDPNSEIDMFELFPATKYQTAFKDKRARDDFDAGIEHLKKTGGYDKIYKEYSEKYFEVKQ